MAAVDTLINTCPACGAEESLDALIGRMIDDEQVRRLIADVLNSSLPLGGLVLRYLRLHKPAKQRLRMDKVAKILSELLTDMQRRFIVRKGRDWSIDTEGWKLAFEAVFAAEQKGSLTLPLEGNAYLYEVVMRLSDKAEAEIEKNGANAARSRSYTGGATSIGDVLTATTPSLRATPSSLKGNFENPNSFPFGNEGVARSDGVVAPAPVIAAPRERTESPTVKAFKAEQAAKLALRSKQPTQE